MHSQIRRLSFLFLLTSLCFSKIPLKIQIDDLPEQRPVELAVEMPMATGFPDVSAFTDGALLLQKSPALFQDASGDLMPTVCALLTPACHNGIATVFPSKTKNLFQFKKKSGKLYIEESGKPVLAFVFQPQLPEGVPEDRRRSIYIDPIYDPLQQIVTDDFPKDHYHHRGLSWMWPHVFVAGQDYSLWDLRGGICQVFENWLAQESGPLAAILGIKNSWQIHGRKVVDEWVWLRVFRSSAQGRVIDLRISLRPLEQIALLGAEGKGYGGLSFRFAPRDCTILTSPQGIISKDSDNQRFAWADLSARFHSALNFSGVTILPHPDNPDAPSEWCLRHYGFLGVSWPGLRKTVLPPNETITFRYRIWLHRDDAEKALVDKIYEGFIHPPQIRLAKK